LRRGADFGDEIFLLGINERVKEVLFECCIHGYGEVPNAIMLSHIGCVPHGRDECVGVLAGNNEELTTDIEGGHSDWVDSQSDGRWRYDVSISQYSFCCTSKFVEMAVAL
jgi:hypothetical protein